MSESYDVFLRNVMVVDGTGKRPFKASIGIRGEKIAAVGDFKGEAKREIDGSGLVACPGFIDPHSHADLGLLRYPQAGSLVMQGITTFLGGNCGMSPAPVGDRYISIFASVGEWWAEAEPDEPTPPLLLPLDKYGEFIKEKLGYAVDWRTFGEYLSKVEGTGISVNFAPLVGHGSVRATVMGEDFQRAATPGEIEEMAVHVEEAMRSGAFGLSIGFDYLPGEYASVEEVVELEKVATKYGGLHVPHMRHVHTHWATDDPDECGIGVFHGPLEDIWVGRYRGLLEAIEITQRAQIPLHIVHLDNVFRMPQPHPDYLEEAAARATLEIVDKAREEGLDITFNVISCPPTDIGGAKLLITEFWNSMSPPLQWLNQLGKEEFIEKLKTQELRDKIKEISNRSGFNIGLTHTKADPFWAKRFKILKCKNKALEEKTLVELSGERDSEPFDTLFDILIEDPDTLWLQTDDERSMQAAKAVFLKHPAAMPCSDMTVHPAKPPTPLPLDLFGFAPPMAFGMYAYYLGKWVRDEKLLSLEEAVKKATYMPAQMLGLEDRGVVRTGAYADLVVFDLDKVRMTGDFLNPAQPPEGIEHVLVNGRVVYEHKKHTGERPGKVLRHNAPRLS